jgi:prophage regulatory protein
MPTETRTFKSLLKHSNSSDAEVRPESSMTDTCSAPIHILRLAQVIERTGLKKTKIYELQSDGQFPMRVKITAHAVGWIEHEVQAWLAGRIAKNSPLRTHDSRA